MGDIVEQLRSFDTQKMDAWGICDEAADEIERLREALREIVKHSDYDDPVRDMALAALGEKE